MTIDFTYEMNDKEIVLAKLQRKCRECMAVIEGYEELRGNPEITEEELNAAIKEENEKLAAYEHEITKIVWNVA